MVSGPGVGTEPRQPQIVARTPLSLLTPEDRDDPDELVRVREEWERCHRDVTLDPVRARYAEVLMRRSPLVEGDARRPSLGRERPRVGRPRLETRRPFVKRH